MKFPQVAVPPSFFTVPVLVKVVGGAPASLVVAEAVRVLPFCIVRLALEVNLPIKVLLFVTLTLPEVTLSFQVIGVPPTPPVGSFVLMVAPSSATVPAPGAMIPGLIYVVLTFEIQGTVGRRGHGNARAGVCPERNTGAAVKAQRLWRSRRPSVCRNAVGCAVNPGNRAVATDVSTENKIATAGISDGTAGQIQEVAIANGGSTGCCSIIQSPGVHVYAAVVSHRPGHIEFVPVEKPCC